MTLPHADAVLAALAAEQHGTVSHRQLVDAGLSRRQIEQRVRSGHLIRLHRGVYAVGHTALPPLAPFAAALLAVGPHAALSHWSAAVVWRLIPAEEGAPVHVSITQGQARHRPGIRVHRLNRIDLRVREGLRVTSPPQTLVQLARSPVYERAVNEALALRLVRDDASPGVTKSELERRFRRVVEQAGLPTPRYNEPIGGRQVDAVWVRERLAVELDSWQFHGHRLAFERDRLTDQRLQAHGYRSMRVTDRQLAKPLQVAAALATALAS